MSIDEPTGLYRSGDKAPKSGIYRVHHRGNHAEPHEVTVVYGDNFPQCNECGRLVRFVLVKPAQHVGSNQHFYKVTMPTHDPKKA